MVSEAHNAVTEQMSTIKAKAEPAALYIMPKLKY